MLWRNNTEEKKNPSKCHVLKCIEKNLLLSICRTTGKGQPSLVRGCISSCKICPEDIHVEKYLMGTSSSRWRVQWTRSKENWCFLGNRVCNYFFLDTLIPTILPKNRRLKALCRKQSANGWWDIPECCFTTWTIPGAIGCSRSLTKNVIFAASVHLESFCAFEYRPVELIH